MPSLTDVYVAVRPDTANFDSDLRKKLRGVDAERAGKDMGGRFGGAFSGIASKAVLGLGGAFAALGVGKVFAGFVKDAAESAKISRLTEAAIKSTGGAARITADQVGALATALSNKSAVDDELIQNSANVLLTFTKVRNEAGKGNDIFNQGAEAALNMSAALGTDLQGATMLVGKALNDPIKGMGALSKAGVQFTQQQKDQIKTLVASGDTLGAQKIILAEFQSQFGGAAAAAASPMERLKVVAGNLGERIGGALLPHIERLAVFVSDKLIPTLGSLADRHGPAVGRFLGDLARIFRDEVLPRLKQFAGFIVDDVVPAVIVMGSFISDAWTNVIYPTFAAISDFVTGTLVPTVRSLWTDTIEPAFKGIGAAISVAWTKVIQPVLSALGGFITGTLIPVVSFLWRNVVEPAFKGISFAIKVFWETAKVIFGAAKTYVDTVLIPVFTFLWRNVVEPAFAGISFAIKTFWAVASLIFAAVKLYVETVLIPMFNFLWRNVVEPVFKGIGDTISFAWNNVIKPVFSALGGFITDHVAPAFRRGVDAIGSAWDRIKELAAAPIRFVVNTVIQKGIIENFNKIADAVGSSARIPSVSFGATGGAPSGGAATLRQFAAGGFHEDHRAQIAPAGAMRLWAEPETGGEAYIPLTPEPAQRRRSTRIWEETGRRLGMLERFAHGGFSDRGFGGVKPNVAKAGWYFGQKYGIRSIGGVGQRSGPSDHPLGLALDFMTRGENGTALANEAIREMGHFGVKYAIWRQMINSGTGWRRMGDRGNDTANHYDHVHLSFTGAAGGTGGGSGIFGGLLDFLGGLDPVEWVKGKVAGLLSGMPGAGRFGDMARAVPGKIISVIAQKLRDLPGNLLDTAGDLVSRLNPFDTRGGSVQEIVRRIAAGRGWDQGQQWADLYALIQKESSWNPRAQNPTSTAYGLFQFLNSTWASTGYAKTSDPAIQTHAGLKYIAGRYGTPSGAWAFHRRNNWYDAGGVARGAGMMPKLTSAPERVLSPRQTEAFERLVAALDRGAASAGRSAPLVGEIHTHDAAGLDLVLQQAQFRERAGHFG